MDIVVLIFAGTFGLLFGSFVNAWSDRIIVGESMADGRSHCDTCKHVLNPIDLIPLFSWLSLRGKCRYCQASIPIQNPIVEVSMGSLFIFGTYMISPQLAAVSSILVAVYTALFITCLAVIFVVDYREYIIPDVVLLVLTSVTIAFQSAYFLAEGEFYGGVTLLNMLASAIGAALPYLLIILATKGKGMGAGDMKFSFVMGLVLGFPKILVGQYLSFLLGGAFAVIVILLGKKKFGQMLPFGPFLIVGTLVAWWWGDYFWTMFGFV